MVTLETVLWVCCCENHTMLKEYTWHYFDNGMWGWGECNRGYHISAKVWNKYILVFFNLKLSILASYPLKMSTLLDCRDYCNSFARCIVNLRTAFPGFLGLKHKNGGKSRGKGSLSNITHYWWKGIKYTCVHGLRPSLPTDRIL
jgi:hypothetical protein